jgi:predicted regulator of Ras-like GTPase activity (Roadblock/LC7/MglB family)
MANEKEMHEVLDLFQSEIPGFIAASLVDLDSGMTLAVRSNRSDFDLAVASAYNSELVKQKQKIMKALNLKTHLEDMILTLGDQIHFIKLVSPTTFIYLAADRASSNMAIIRTVVLKHSKHLGV